MNEQRKWYTTSKPDDAQGLIADEHTGKNIAVSYDVKDAPVIAAAPELVRMLRSAVAYVELFTGSGVREQPSAEYIKSNGDFDAAAIARDARALIQEATNE